jgi:dynamin 1-like protein
MSRSVRAPNSPLPPALPPQTLRVPKAVSDQEGVQVEVTRVLVDSYFDIVRKNLQDAVPKALMYFLVNSTRRGLQQHLIRALYREELFAEIMVEREDVAAKRQQCLEALRTLRAALKTLEGLPGELAGRVGASGARFSFKQMLRAVDDGAEGAGSRPPSRPPSRPASRHASPSRGPRLPRDARRDADAAAAQLSAAQKAALSAVTLLSGGGGGGGRAGDIAAYRTPQ